MDDFAPPCPVAPLKPKLVSQSDHLIRSLYRLRPRHLDFARVDFEPANKLQ